MPAWTQPVTPPTAGGVEKNRYDIIIPAPDGQQIGLTVFQPQLAAGATAPLILLGHGFGLTRVRHLENPDPIEGFLHGDVTTQAARLAWQSGYYVIAFDQRGFGESTGTVTVMDPKVDGRNISAIVTWAEQHLPQLAYRDGDIELGALGLSYGGGFQTIGAGVDPRFDAIVPTASWFDLSYSLAPDGVPKTLWLDLLAPTGALSARLQLEPYVYQAFLDSELGSVPPDVLARFYLHSPKSFCDGIRPDGLGTPKVAAFFVQGASDVLFNINEAASLRACWRDAGNDARLLVVDQGHIIPLFQPTGPQILFGVPEAVTCGTQQYQVPQLMLDFLNEKLRGFVQDRPVPDLCFAQGDDLGETPTDVPRGGVTANVPATTVLQGAPGETLGLIGNPPVPALLDFLYTLPDHSLEALASALGGISDPTRFASVLSGIVGLVPSGVIQDTTAPPTFVPLYTATADGTLVGIPTAILDVTGPSNALLFAGLGLRPAAGGRTELINEQVRPLAGTGQHAVDLVGVSRRIQSGDTLGLMLYGFHPYFLNRSLLQLTPASVTVSGTVSLPVF